MGSTCVAIHLAEGMVHIAHVGDSRCYRIRDGEIKQMTRDHSLINDALDMKPDLTKEELARLPKNIITRALGMKDFGQGRHQVRGRAARRLYLLCSDGLTGMVPVEHILDVINLTPEPLEACELLVAEANDHGGTDNISALLVRVEDPAEAHRRDDPGEIDISSHAELEHDEDELNADGLAELVDDGGGPRPPPNPPGPPPAAPVAAPSRPAPPPPAPSRPVAVRPFIPPPPPVPVARNTPAPPAPVKLAEAPRPVPVATGDTPRPLPTPVPAPLVPAPIIAIAGSPSSRPVLQLRPEEDDRPSAPTDVTDLETLVTAEEAAALASGGEIDLDVHGPWAGAATVPRCAHCDFELFPGNSFCVECGARIEAASA